MLDLAPKLPEDFQGRYAGVPQKFGLEWISPRVANIMTPGWCRSAAMRGSGLLIGEESKPAVSARLLGGPRSELRIHRIRVHQFALQPSGSTLMP
ncbi:MAG: hypothetical protein HZB20_06975 [Chloroflexi bacterium]|nr:hypothetical protein [Chloroflexota bacterium]